MKETWQLSRYLLTIEQDGAPRHGEHIATTTLAPRFEQLRHVVLDVGS
jgi:hypothetical protein